ncbi:hypothetical protein CCR75_002428 [Bremia lactucae]|uniref:Spen paralogue and orthologue SPOC C-terminal domain-containing protein n=1 Tax=Bremia lactucae TaxID=4779 RepID=A0A976FII6_BRELC|nr:hypothetical protein CCR75_002428 [Bremia lactucae]
MVAFSVYKSSKYLFDCVSTTDVAPSQPYSMAKQDAFEALQLDSVDVVKRIDNAELKTLIACCEEPPLEAIVTPVTHGDIVPFQTFAKYLNNRQRAGVVILADGRLLILAPVQKDELRLQCIVVKPTSEIAAALSSSSKARSVRDAKLTHFSQNAMQTHASSITPTPTLEPSSKKSRRSQVWPDSSSNYGSAEANHGSRAERREDDRNEIAPPAALMNGKPYLLSSLSRIERATQIAKLRQDYERFNEHYYNVLQEWSNADPTT